MPTACYRPPGRSDLIRDGAAVVIGLKAKSSLSANHFRRATVPISGRGPAVTDIS